MTVIGGGRFHRPDKENFLTVYAEVESRTIKFAISQLTNKTRKPQVGFTFVAQLHNGGEKPVVCSGMHAKEFLLVRFPDRNRR